MYDDYLYHHGVKGMKWGVRRYRNYDGTLTPAGKERYDDQDAVPKDPKQDSNASYKRYVVAGAAVAGVALAGLGALYVYKQYNAPSHFQYIRYGTDIDPRSLNGDDRVLKKGTKLFRMSSKSVEDYANMGRAYVAHLKSDSRLYKYSMPQFFRDWGRSGIIDDDGKSAFQHIIRAQKDISIMSERKLAELYKEFEGVATIDAGYYTRFMTGLADRKNPRAVAFLERVAELGYDAIVDLNDSGNFTKDPLIIVNPENVFGKTKTHKVGRAEQFMNVLLMPGGYYA